MRHQSKFDPCLANDFFFLGEVVQLSLHFFRLFTFRSGPLLIRLKSLVPAFLGKFSFGLKNHRSLLFSLEVVDGPVFTHLFKLRFFSTQFLMGGRLGLGMFLQCVVASRFGLGFLYF